MLLCPYSAKTLVNEKFSMPIFFSIALGLGPIEIGVILFTGLGFLVMFGYSSATGGYKELIETTLENDQTIRKKNLSKDP